MKIILIMTLLLSFPTMAADFVCQFDPNEITPELVQYFSLNEGVWNSETKIYTNHPPANIEFAFTVGHDGKAIIEVMSSGYNHPTRKKMYRKLTRVSWYDSMSGLKVFAYSPYAIYDGVRDFTVEVDAQKRIARAYLRLGYTASKPTGLYLICR